MLTIRARKRLAEFEWRGELRTGCEVMALFGPSGAGKTSLVNMIAGLTSPDEGEIAIGERLVFHSESGLNLPPEQRRVGVVFQDGRLFPHLTVRGNLTFGRGRGKRAPDGSSAPGLGRIVELLELGALLNRRPLTLSGGERQRVAIGRALLSAPQALLLDEPLAGLDGERREEVLSFLERLKQERDLVMVYVTHRMEEVVRLADRLALIDRGAIQAAGAPRDLLAQPELQSLTGRRTAGALLACRVERAHDSDGLSRLDCSGHTLLLPGLGLSGGTELLLRVRAGDVSLSLERPRRSSALNVLEGVVNRVVEEDGALADVVVDTGQSLWARVTRRSVRELELAPGQHVYATIKAASLYPAS